MSGFDEKTQLEALETMRTTFGTEDGSGMPMNDVTYGRYLRARYSATETVAKLLHMFDLVVLS
jgi:hypothetical protein